MLFRRVLCLLLWPQLALTILPNIVINEIHSNPAIKTELVEFVELYNTSSAEGDLGGWNFSGTVSYTFPTGTKIAANGYVVAAQNPAALKRKYNYDAFGPWVG